MKVILNILKVLYVTSPLSSSYIQDLPWHFKSFPFMASGLAWPVVNQKSKQEVALCSH